MITGIDQLEVKLQLKYLIYRMIEEKWAKLFLVSREHVIFIQM